MKHKTLISCHIGSHQIRSDLVISHHDGIQCVRDYRDADCAIVRPLPRVKRSLSEHTCLPHIVQVIIIHRSSNEYSLFDHTSLPHISFYFYVIIIVTSLHYYYYIIHCQNTLACITLVA